MRRKPRVCFLYQPPIKPLFAYARFIAAANNDRPTVRVEREREPPDTAIRGVKMLPHPMRNFMTFPLKQGEFVRQLWKEARQGREGKIKLLRFAVMAMLVGGLLGESAIQFAPGPSRIGTEGQRILGIVKRVQDGDLDAAMSLPAWVMDAVLAYLPGSNGVKNISRAVSAIRQGGGDDSDRRNARFRELKEERRQRVLRSKDRQRQRRDELRTRRAS